MSTELAQLDRNRMTPDPAPDVDRGPSTAVSEPLLYTVPEAAETLRIGRSSLYELIATGQIDSITIGARRLIPADDLRAFINSRRKSR